MLCTGTERLELCFRSSPQALARVVRTKRPTNGKFEELRETGLQEYESFQIEEANQGVDVFESGGPETQK